MNTTRRKINLNNEDYLECISRCHRLRASDLYLYYPGSFLFPFVSCRRGTVCFPTNMCSSVFHVNL